MKIKSEKLLSIFLYLVFLHSLIAGLLLIFLPVETMKFFGFPEFENNFFRAQGGVFHVVLCIAYLKGANNPVKNNLYINFSYTAKFMAFVFLTVYYLLINHILVVLLSGIADLMMGIIIFVLNKNIIKTNNCHVQAER